MGILETIILSVDESYLCKKCARKPDTEDFNNAVAEIYKQKTSFFLFGRARSCARKNFSSLLQPPVTVNIIVNVFLQPKMCL
jgi:hypothetical protein